jgi:predicted double-glycine peptidase
VLTGTHASAQAPLRVLDVPYIAQSEALCGGAAAAMVLRFWGAREVSAESFAALVDARAGGIRTDDLTDDLRRRGWNVVGAAGRVELLDRELVAGRPAIVLIEDRPRAFHYVVVVSATPDAVLFHDPARSPYRAMPRAEFERRWSVADWWMGIVTPGPGAASAEPQPTAASGRRGVTHPATAGDACQASVSDAAAAAASGDFARAERVLASASCPPAILFRELGGVRAQQRRWPEALELAESALAAAPGDEIARRLAGTARFVQNDGAGALVDWNAVNEPRVDTLQIEGLRRTRVPTVLSAAGVEPGRLVTPASLVHARRRLALVPAVSGATVDYRPAPGGLAEVHALVVERPLVPTSAPALAGLAAPAAFARTVNVALGSPSGGGDRVDLSWRFWEGQPRLAADYHAPAPWGGTWGVGASWERQPFDLVSLPTAERRSARATWSEWVAPQVRVAVRGGADRWIARQETLGFAGGTLGFASLGDRARAQLDLDAWWGGAQPFSSLQGLVVLQSSTARRGFNLSSTAGLGRMGDSASPEIWYGGDTGRARPVLLRAHRLLRDGVMAADRIGRSLLHATVEGQYWWSARRFPVGAAVFADTVWLDRRAMPGTRRDVDVGVGVRAQVPGAGDVRVDVARGLTDGHLRASIGFQP